MSLALDAAVKARKSEEEALYAALTRAETLLERQQESARSLEEEIVSLNQQVETIRHNFTSAADSPVTVNSSSSEAKTLLSTLEKTYKKHNQLKSCREKITESQANIDYIRSRYNTASERLKALEEQLPLVKERLDSTREYFTAGAPQPDEEAPQEETAPARVKAARPAAQARGRIAATIWSYAKIILVAILLAFVVRVYVFDITRVDGLSMYPTLNDHDDLIHLKITYLFSEPQRGDIVVFDAPDAVGKDYVKRIIGLPNEQVTIERGQVYINGKRLNESYVDGAYTVGDINTVLPDGFYFVMGDNREISRDSRYDEVGLISIDRIHGKAVFRVFPFNDFGVIE
ncbi:MAG: signal peptidase I [Clostridia bacterium]|nr:signal peptidase I [Clostridia bacterium]